MTLESQREERIAKGIDPCNLVTLREREKNDSRTGPGLRPLGGKEMRRRLTRLRSLSRSCDGGTEIVLALHVGRA
jgi:hypothetical protein